MIELTITVVDGMKVSPLFEKQVDPTRLNLVHPNKHIAPLKSEDFKDSPFSLFISTEQRNQFIDLISSNELFKRIIAEKLIEKGGNFRVFADIKVHYLVCQNGNAQMEYWSYCADSAKHQKKPLEWVSLGLDFVSDMQSKEKMVASMQTIFPLETKAKLFPSYPTTNTLNYLKAMKAHKETVIFMDVVCQAYTEKCTYSAAGQKLELYDLSSQPFSLLPRWHHLQSKHNIFHCSAAKVSEHDVRKRVVSSFSSLPFTPHSAPKLEKMEQRVIIEEFSNFNSESSQVKITGYLTALGFNAENSNTIVKQIDCLDVKQLDVQADFEQVVAVLEKKNKRGYRVDRIS